MEEQVNHPGHYNRHPAGIECIDIIRHYTCDIANAIKYLWRAGLKKETGMEDADKEVEDLRKALWYIGDYTASRRLSGPRQDVLARSADTVLYEETGYHISNVETGFSPHVASAIGALLRVGIVRSKTGAVYETREWEFWLDTAARNIHLQILDVEEGTLFRGVDALCVREMASVPEPGDDPVSTSYTIGVAAGMEAERKKMLEDAVAACVTSRANECGEYMPEVCVPVSRSFAEGERVRVLVVKDNLKDKEI